MIKLVVDEAVYAAIHENLKEQFRGNLDKAQCIIENFRENQVADSLQGLRIIDDHEKLQTEIKPLVRSVNWKCSIIAFTRSAFGICFLIGMLIAAVALFVFIFRLRLKGSYEVKKISPICEEFELATTAIHH